MTTKAPSRRIRTRAAVGLMLILLISTTTLGAFFLQYERKALQNALEVKVASLADLVAGASASPIRKYSYYHLEQLALIAENAPYVQFCEIYDTHGESLLQSDRIQAKRLENKQLPLRTSTTHVLVKSIRDDGEILGSVELGYNTDSINKDLFDRGMNMLMALFSMSLMLAVGLYIYFEHIFISPLNSLLNTVHEMGAGNFTHSLLANREDEIGHLAKGFNDMSKSLEALYRDLEQKVETRTASMRAANEKLTQEVQERKKAQVRLRETLIELSAAMEKVQAAKKTAEEANKAKSEFLANMSHEIRTPMNAMLGMADVLARSGLSPDQREYAEILNNSGNILLRVINDVLDFSKIEAGQTTLEREPFDLLEETENTCRTVAYTAHGKQLELFCHVSNECGQTQFVGDAGKFRQILMNLLANAVKFTTNGYVAVELSMVDQDEKTATFRCSIKDTGIGIPADKQEHIFNSFSQADGSTTRQYGGTGLGLAISKKLVELMGGHISVSSRPGAGSTFQFTVVLDKTDRKGTIAQEESADLFKGKRALVVTPYEICQRGCREILEELGMSVVVAANWMEATSLAVVANNSQIGYDYILIEPDSDLLQRGMERSLRQYFPDSTIMTFVNSTIDPEEKKALRRAGFHVLNKPLGRIELLNRLRFRLDSSSQDTEQGLTRLQSLGSFTLLLVEDNPANRKLVNAFLQDTQAIIHEAANGAEAIQLCRQNRYDIVLMDIEMPLMDGYQATRILRQLEQEKETPPMPIVALTAHVFKEYRQKCDEFGFTDFLFKPVVREKLFACLCNYLDPESPPVLLAETHSKGDDSGKTTSAQDETPPLDEQKLISRIAIEPDIADLIPFFIQITQDDLLDMNKALKENDLATLGRLGHSLKGAARNYGFEDLGDLGEIIEKAADDKDLDRAQAALDSVERYLAIIGPRFS